MQHKLHHVVNYHVGMRKLRLIPLFLVASLWLLSGVVHAAPFVQGVYEFESCAANCTPVGSWVTEAWGSVDYVSTSTLNDSISFQATGSHLVVYRQVFAGGGSLEICVDATCTTWTNNNSWTDFSYPSVVSLSGTNTITITNKSAGIVLRLDQFMILDNPAGGSFPTPVPTATAVPTSTPMNTPVHTPTPMDTPVDTPTPIASVTPISFVWAVDPASDYRMVNGQIVRDEYSMSGGDHTMTALLVIVAISSVISLVVNLWKR